MSEPHAAVVYNGVSYPVTTDTIQAIINRIGQFDLITDADLFQITTTDGRKVALHLSQSFPIAFEVQADLEGQ